MSPPVPTAQLLSIPADLASKFHDGNLYKEDEITGQKPKLPVNDIEYLESLTHALATSFNDRDFSTTSPGFRFMTRYIRINHKDFPPDSYVSVAKMTNFIREKVQNIPDWTVDVSSQSTTLYGQPHGTKGQVFCEMKSVGREMPGAVMMGVVVLEFEVLDGEWKCVAMHCAEGQYE